MTSTEQTLIDSTIQTLQNLHVSQGFIWSLSKALMTHYLLNFDANEASNRIEVFAATIKSETEELRNEGEIK